MEWLELRYIELGRKCLKRHRLQSRFELSSFKELILRVQRKYMHGLKLKQKETSRGMERCSKMKF